ncbi:MAG: cysteine dioxygenase, partial [Actinomycetota bacterium]|nr:cysteine dioxygenase [Actinomycetota bacterium]
MANAERTAAVAEAMSDIRDIDAEGIDRDSVDLIRRRLIELAGQKELFAWSDFPPDDSKDGSTL